MKKFLKYTVLVFIIGATVVFSYQTYQEKINVSPCDRTIYYSIGQFDTQFGLSKEDFKNDLAQAETVWEKALGRDVFVYKEDADFKINLIYDERQIETNQKQKTEFGLSAAEDIFRQLDQKFDEYKNQYDRESSVYEFALNEFNTRKSAYEKTVSEWNSRGGATKEVYNQLEAEREYLNNKATELNTEAEKINSMSKQLNTLLDERNAKAVEYNKIAKSYNEKYGEALEFNQAEYVSSGANEEINIYQYSTSKDLVLALTHEFGHALGLNHVENSKSIMYYLTESNTKDSPILSSEDLTELKRVCVLP